jgi:hypothetical protein
MRTIKYQCAPDRGHRSPVAARASQPDTLALVSGEDDSYFAAEYVQLWRFELRASREHEHVSPLSFFQVHEEAVPQPVTPQSSPGRVAEEYCFSGQPVAKSQSPPSLQPPSAGAVKRQSRSVTNRYRMIAPPPLTASRTTASS